MKRALYVAAGWAMVAAIVWLSLTPAPPQLGVEHSDKAGHLAGYSLLMFWFCQLYARRIFFAIGFTLMGIALEFLQGHLGYRSYEVLDMVANTLGVLLGWGVALLLPKPLVK